MCVPLSLFHAPRYVTPVGDCVWLTETLMQKGAGGLFYVDIPLSSIPADTLHLLRVRGVL